MTEGNAERIVRQTKTMVECRKHDIAAWRERYSPDQQIEVRIAMLETVLDELVDLHGEFDAQEIIEQAMHRSAAKARGPLQ